MSERVAAYGFLGRFPGDVMRDRYLMPCSVHAPLSNFRLFSLVLWPDVFSQDEHLLSLKVRSKEGIWKERLVSPEPLRHYVPRAKYEVVVSGCVPPSLRTQPGRFFSFVGEMPLSWASLDDRSPGASLDLPTSLCGPVAVRWSGALRGLLLLGTIQP